MRKLGGRSCLGSLAGITLLVALGCTGKNKTEDLTHVKPDFSLTAEQYREEFMKNEKAARAKFNGKVVELTGVLLMFGPPREEVPGPTFHLLAREAKPIPKFVLCTSGDSSPWKRATPDQTVTVRGRAVDGELRSCQIIEVKGPPAPALTAAQFTKDSEKYQERWVIVTGEIETITTYEASDDPELILKTDGTRPHVACLFRFFAEPAKECKAGQQVKILGRYLGKGRRSSLDLEACILIE